MKYIVEYIHPSDNGFYFDRDKNYSAEIILLEYIYELKPQEMMF